MMIKSVHISRFKLLRDVTIHFSVDPERPLTVIRGENGSGKTSLLYAMLWGLYGMAGLTKVANIEAPRLTSTFCRAGSPVAVEVEIVFSHTDDMGTNSEFRLRRMVLETPQVEGPPRRSQDSLTLARLTPEGDKLVPAAEAWVERLVPLRLSELFFTNGDDIQKFISGRVYSHERQAKVHQAIRELLGIDQLTTAVGDLKNVHGGLKRRVSAESGKDAEELEEQCEALRQQITEQEQLRTATEGRKKSMETQQHEWERELAQLRGIGDLDELNAQISTLKGRIQACRAREDAALADMKSAFKGQPLSRAFTAAGLANGQAKLEELADRRVIPNTSLKVLQDRLEEEECICGSDLHPGTALRDHVVQLLEEQREHSDMAQRLTELRYSAAAFDLAAADVDAFAAKRQATLADYTAARDDLNRADVELKQAESKRSRIDDARVRTLTDELAAVGKKIAAGVLELGRIAERIAQYERQLEEREQELSKVTQKNRANQDLIIKRDVAEELRELAERVQRRLEDEYVKKVSTRLQEIFLSIVGAEPDAHLGVFKGVSITDKFDIVVESQNGTNLDTDYELNGASQRALTLAFIWSLMEVAAITAPRLIDTPLGMVSGGVKQRMVNTITHPPTGDEPPYQVILLLTRSEIMEVGDLLQQHAGAFTTISCSKDYPTDLVYDWLGEDSEQAEVRACACTHEQSCRICARHIDNAHGLAFQDIEVTV
ncbi:AAA family ATPase [Micromonospora sp. R77]|uniref:AAA family ATPase n=1 Tax=Micromonospora sp. R77 TaxID=2925836 RepID=UPI001F60B980|nr:AAA family ATPase [Micromonospora sp. R77]MCI4064016.1 AAA family ATPase [Micromonospora sp. R77]